MALTTSRTTRSANSASASTLDRRGLIKSAGGFAALAVAGSLSQPAWAQTTIPAAKLMAPGALPDVTIGNKDATVTIVEYASLSCPACARFHNGAYKKLKEKYIDTGKVLLVMREFPTNTIAAAVSMLTRCAGDNDKTAALIGIFMERQSDWLVRGNAEPKLFEIAKQAGFTREKFDACLKDEKLFEKIVKGRDRASKEFGVNATPTFFINGRRFTGNFGSIEAFSKVIDPLLKQNS